MSVVCQNTAVRKLISALLIYCSCLESTTPKLCVQFALGRASLFWPFLSVASQIPAKQPILSLSQDF